MNHRFCHHRIGNAGLWAMVLACQSAICTQRWAQAETAGAPPVAQAMPIMSAPGAMPITHDLANPGCANGQCGNGEAGCTPSNSVWSPWYPCWSVRAEAIALKREIRDDRGLGVVFNPINNTFLNPTLRRDMEFNYDVGTRLTFTRGIDCTTATEIVAWGLHDMEQERVLAAPAPTGINSTNFDGLINPARTQFYRYESDFNSVEGNVRHLIHQYPHAHLLWGVRAMRIQEEFNVTETGVGRNRAGAVVGVGGASEVGATNYLLGVQLGLETITPVGCNLEIGSYLKGGLFANFANLEATRGVTDSLNGPIAGFAQRDRIETSGMFELGSFANVWLRPNLLLRGGYQLFVIQGVALASEQFPPVFGTNGRATFDVDGTFIAHGPFLGLEWRWGDCGGCNGGCNGGCGL